MAGLVPAIHALAADRDVDGGGKTPPDGGKGDSASTCAEACDTRTKKPGGRTVSLPCCWHASDISSALTKARRNGPRTKQYGGNPMRVSRRTLLQSAAAASAMTMTGGIHAPAIAQNKPVRIGI